jgi:RNA polymerase sigma-70 factor (ECF subfamily)
MMVALEAQSASQDQEGALLARCRAGDRAAWRGLYAMHFSFVVRTARSLGTPPSEVEDVAQEVFTLAFRKLDAFTHGQLATWLYRICANVVTDHHRKRRVRQAFSALFGEQAEPVSTSPGPEGQVQAAQAQAQVGQILARMSPKKREVFVLFEIEGCTGEEIAERVGCPVDTVWTRLFHARKEFARIGQKQGLLEGAP